MDFELKDTPEMAVFRGEVREFLKEIIPGDLAISPDPDKHTEEQYHKRREIGRRLGARGWLYPTWPTEYGGGGLTMDHAIVIEEEIDEYQLTLPPYYDSGGHLGGADILVWGTEEQKKAFLPPMLKGEVVTWQLLTEPHGGSDLASTKTAAIRDGDEYVLNGTKTFVGSNHKPDQMFTIVLTDPQGPRHQNLSWIMVPGDLPGITIQPLDLLGLGGEGGAPSGHKNSVFFEEVRVPAFNLVGGENNGWKVATTHLELEHGGGGRVGRNRQLDRFFEYCVGAKFNGEAIGKDPDVRELLADIYVEGDINRLFGLRNFWMRHARRTPSYEGSQSVFFRRLSGLRNVRSMQQVLGYLSLIRDPEWAPAGGWLELYARSGVGGLHGGGTLDTDRVIMARRMGLGRTVREEAGKMD